ncbi:MAG: hypothetical protein JXQ90_12480 [Cyclobacteriaceae bacterium]
MSAYVDPFLKTLDVSIDKAKISIKRRKKRNVLALVLGIFIGIPLIIASYFFLTLGTYVDGTVFGVLAIIIAIAVWNMNSAGLYPETKFDLSAKHIVKKPILAFLKPIELRYKTLKGVSLSTKAVNGGTSAYEEGNTDYRKSLILETDNGEITLFTYYSRKEEAEDSLLKFADFIEQKVTSAPV